MKNLYIQEEKIVYGNPVFGSDEKILNYFIDTMQAEYSQKKEELSVPVPSIEQMIDLLDEKDESKIEPIITRYFPEYHNLFPNYDRVCAYLKFCLQTILDTADSSDGTVRLSWLDKEGIN